MSLCSHFLMALNSFSIMPFNSTLLLRNFLCPFTPSFLPRNRKKHPSIKYRWINIQTTKSHGYTYRWSKLAYVIFELLSGVMSCQVTFGGNQKSSFQNHVQNDVKASVIFVFVPTASNDLFTQLFIVFEEDQRVLISILFHWSILWYVLFVSL